MKKKKHIVLKIFIAVMALTAIYFVIFSYTDKMFSKEQFSLLGNVYEPYYYEVDFFMPYGSDHNPMTKDRSFITLFGVSKCREDKNNTFLYSRFIQTIMYKRKDVKIPAFPDYNDIDKIAVTDYNNTEQTLSYITDTSEIKTLITYFNDLRNKGYEPQLPENGNVGIFAFSNKYGGYYEISQKACSVIFENEEIVLQNHSETVPENVQSIILKNLKH